MVYGDPAKEHLQLNEETIYAGKQMDRDNPKARAALPEIRRLLLADKVFEAEKLAESMMATPLRQPPYEPLGDITVRLEKFDNVTDYGRRLDLIDGLASVEYRSGATHYKRVAFASYPDDVIALHLEATGPEKLHFTVDLTRVSDATARVAGTDTLVLTGQARPPKTGRGYPGEPDTGVRFTAASKVLTDGTVRATAGRSLEIGGASQATVLLAASTDVHSPNPESESLEQLKAAAQRGYADLLERHLRDFRALSSRVHLSLGDSDGVIEKTPTDELLKNTTKENTGALSALYFAYGRYLLQSSSRATTLPANLQGKWNEDFDPSWGSKYTININTEMNYWPAESTYLGETALSLHQLFDRMLPNGRRTAQETYGTAGLVAHHNTEVWGDTQPIDGVPYGLWPDGAAWLSLTLWEHYDYSRDLAYLRKRAYPIMRECAVFLLDNLFDDGAGHLVSGPSLSPENKYLTPEGKSASLDLSPTFDVELTRALFDRVRQAASLLKVDGEFSRKLAAAESKLIPLQVGRFGQLQEWRRDYPEHEPGHRHMSHLFAVYPSSEINRETPQLWKAARTSLERRLANKGGGTGWSRAWVVCLWAAFGEGNKAEESLRVLFEQSTWPNLFDLHPPHIFQIDGNLGATAGISEMLLQSRGPEIHLLPALPSSWPSGSVTGLRVRGNATVDLTWSEGRVRTLKITSPIGGAWSVSVSGAPSQQVRLKPGGTRTVQFS